MANFEFAPWIRPPESLAQNYLSGLKAGADISREQAALQQQASLSMMEANLKQQQLQRENALSQQRMEIEKAYQNHNLQLRQQELQQQQQLNQLKIQEAARTLSARQQYQQAIAGGMGIPEAILKFFPGTDESMTGYGQLARQLAQDKRVVPPPSVETYGGEKFLKVTEPSGAIQYKPLRGEGRDVLSDRMATMKIRSLERQRDTIQKELDADTLGELASGKDPSSLDPLGKVQAAKYLQRKQRLQTLESQIDDLYAGGGGSAAAGTGETSDADTEAFDLTFTRDPRTGKLVKQGGSATAPAAATTPAAAPAPDFQSPTGFGQGYVPQRQWPSAPSGGPSTILAPPPPQTPPGFGQGYVQPPFPSPGGPSIFGAPTHPTAGVTTNDALIGAWDSLLKFLNPGESRILPPTGNPRFVPRTQSAPVTPSPLDIDPATLMGGFTNQGTLPPRPVSDYE